MNKSPKSWQKLAAIPLVAALALSGCGGDDEASENGGGAGGTVNISGSSTVEPISARVAELAEDAGVEAQINVDGPGTGDGFQLFCEGETDLSNGSRAIKAEEAEVCEANDIEFVELKVAYDGIAVITNPDNDVECLSFADLYALIGPESQGFSNWSDAQDLAEELGSDTEFPDGSLDINAPGEESGTYDTFVELVLEGIAEERAEAGKITEEQVDTSRPDYASSADDNAILQGIQGAATSLGWVGLSFVTESGGVVKAIPVSEEPGGDCVEPSFETVSDGSYPIARPLYIYVNTEKAEENQAVEDFVDFFLSDDGIEAVSEVGYVDMPDDELEDVRSVWTERTLGTRDGG